MEEARKHRARAGMPASLPFGSWNADKDKVTVQGIAGSPSAGGDLARHVFSGNSRDVTQNILTRLSIDQH